MRLISLLLLLVLIRTGAGEAGPFWAVVATTDPVGKTALDLVELSQNGAMAPEFKTLQGNAEDEFKAAKAAWEERKKAWEAIRENVGKNFRKVEAEPGKTVVKIVGTVQKDKPKAEELLNKAKLEELFKSNPGMARRKQAINDRLLQFFTIGMDTSAEWLQETREKHGCRFAAISGYLSHVVETPNDVEGKDTWFFKFGGLRKKFEDCKKADVICWNTWYGLAEAPPARYKPGPAKATPVNAKVQSTMIAYWSLVKKFMQLAKEFESVDCVLQIEPDEWGHLLLSCGMNPDASGVVLVGSSGLAELKGLPDSVSGWAKGFRVLRDTYAPHVILCANPSSWDWKGAMSGEKWVEYFKAMGVTPEGGWDLFVTQLHDWDMGLNSNGAKAKWPPYAEADVVARFQTVDAWCAWVKAIHAGTGMWGVAWQLPVGNATYACCDGSDGHGMDGVAELLLEGYPQNTTAQRMAASGCCMWVFSHGGGGASVTDAKKDGVTNPSPHAGGKGLQSLFPDDDGGYMRLKGGDYWKNPVPILAKPVAQKGKKEKAEKPERTEKPEKASEPVAAKPMPKLTDGALRKTWVAKLQAAVRGEVAARREPKFQLSFLKSQVQVRAIDEFQELTVMVDGGGEMTVPWKKLADADLGGLADAMARDGDAESQALAAFFLLLSGDERRAGDHLLRAGTQGAAVEQAFGTDGK